MDPGWHDWHFKLKVKHRWRRFQRRKVNFARSTVWHYAARALWRRKVAPPVWQPFHKQHFPREMLKERTLYPFSNYSRVTIRQENEISSSASLSLFFLSVIFLCRKVHLCPLALVYLLSPPHPSGVRVCVCVCVSSFPRCLGAEGSSAGFLLSLLRGPQRLLIIPDLLALPLSVSHFRPLRLAQVCSLPTHSFFLLCLPPRTFKITPPLGSSR